MITGFEDDLKFEYFGYKKWREHDLCPHCGQRGLKLDESTLLWNERPQATDYEYQCSHCDGEWLIRRFHQSGYEKYPSPPYAVIYLPEGQK